MFCLNYNCSIIEKKTKAFKLINLLATKSLNVFCLFYHKIIKVRNKQHYVLRKKMEIFTSLLNIILDFLLLVDPSVTNSKPKPWVMCTLYWYQVKILWAFICDPWAHASQPLDERNLLVRSTLSSGSFVKMQTVKLVVYQKAD